MNHHTRHTSTPHIFHAHIGSITDLCWSPDGRCLAAVSASGNVAVWDTATGKHVLSQQVTSARLSAVAWSEQGRCLLLGSVTGVLSLLQISTRTLSASSTFSAPITRIAWSPNAVSQRFFVVAGNDLAVFYRGKVAPYTLRYAAPIQDASWSPHGDSIALVCSSGLVEIWDAHTRRVSWSLVQHCAHPRRVSWDARGQRLALGTQDGTVQFQAISDAQSTDVLPLSRFPIQEVHWCERGLIACSEHEMVFWQEEHNASTPMPHPLHQTPIEKVALDPQGLFCATAQHNLVAVAALTSHT